MSSKPTSGNSKCSVENSSVSLIAIYLPTPLAPFFIGLGIGALVTRAVASTVQHAKGKLRVSPNLEPPDQTQKAPLWWRPGRVELYHEHGLGVVVMVATGIKARG